MDPAGETWLDGSQGANVFESLFAELQENCGAIAQFPRDKIEKACDIHEVTAEQRALALATFSDPEKIAEIWTKLQLAAYTEFFIKHAEEKPRKRRRRSFLGDACGEESAGSYGHGDYGSSTGSFGGDGGGGGGSD